MQLVPCAVLALISHPVTRHAFINRVLWAFCVYVEAVSVAPQVVMMQRNKTVEKFTGHYVFFLGVSRFFSCAHWILQMVDGRSSALWAVRIVSLCSQAMLCVCACLKCAELPVAMMVWCNTAMQMLCSGRCEAAWITLVPLLAGNRVGPVANHGTAV